MSGRLSGSVLIVLISSSERSFAAPKLAARAVARRMTVDSFADAARAKRAAARAERLQTETPVDTARGADPVSGGESSEDGTSDDDDSVDGARPRAGAGANGCRAVAGNAT